MRPSIVSLGKHFGNLGKVSCFSFAPLFFEIIICFHWIIILDVWRASLRLGPQRAESIQGIFWAGRRKRTFFRFITLKVWVGFLDIVLIGQAAICLFRFDLFIYIIGCIPRIFIYILNQSYFQVFKTYVWNQWYYYLPQAVAAYLVYDWAKKTNHKASRKNPADYANDQ